MVIDVGNTNTVFALVNNHGIIHKWRMSTIVHRTADEYSVWLIKLLEIEDLDFSSISDCICDNDNEYLDTLTENCEICPENTIKSTQKNKRIGESKDV